MEHGPSIRVYASGRQFVVVPLVTGEDDALLEATPVQSVYLTMGRPVAYTLTRAVRDARAHSETTTDVKAWDGEGGKWWAYHLLRVTIAWAVDGIEITSGPRAKANAGAPSEAEERFTLPEGTPASELAEWLIRHLGERLHSV